MRPVLACAALVASVLLVVTGVAWAKGPNVATVCGSSGCSTYRGELTVLPLYEWLNEPFSLRSPPRNAPYYRIRLVEPGVRASILLYSPSRLAVRIWQGPSQIPGLNQPIGPYWRTVPSDAARAIKPFLRGVTPFPASRGWRH